MDRTQPNLVSKDIFTGEWWVNQSVVDADGDASFAGAYTFFPGGAGWTDYALDRGSSGVMSRIRWVIDEDFLFAYRSYEIIEGGNNDGEAAEFRGQPLAAYSIDHVDVRTTYSGLTGEETTVVDENTTDRRWYERDFIRVDWSMNHVNSFNFLVDDVTMGTGWSMESVPFFIQTDESNPDFNARFAPQFVRVGEDPEYRFRDEWPEGTEDTIHYMSFTSMTLFSPGENCLFIGGGICTTLQVPMRTAFLRVPPNHNFASQQQSHDQFDRFGLFRAEQRTYIRGGLAEVACSTDSDCGAGRYCIPDENVCAGLSSNFGETDLMNFLRPTHNIFRAGLTEQACSANFQCEAEGSTCDLAARRCTIPLTEREIRPVTYTLNEGYPGYLVPSAYEVMGNWNEVFMRGWRAVQGRTIPDYSVGSMECQNDDPTAYCFCGSLDSADGTTCNTEYNPFVPPETWAAQGVAEPYDCYIANDGFAEPANPTSFDQYPIPAVYNYEFRGTECMFMLESNTCDLFRTDVNTPCEQVRDADDQPISWQQHGDIRYQFFNYIHTAGVPFGGLSEIRGDATTGEIIGGDANINSGAIDGQRTRAIEWFPVLRCRSALGCAPGEENADIRYLEGENVRTYHDNLGRTEFPVSIAPSGTDGTGETGGERPPIDARFRGIPASSGSNSVRLAALDEVMDRMPHIENLLGEDSSFHILSGRMRNLEGTQIEAQFLNSLEGEAMHAHFRGRSLNPITTVADNASIMDNGVIEQVSPFRGQAFIDQLNHQEVFEQRMAARGACFLDSLDGRDFQRSRYWEYWAEAFRGRPLEEAAIRMAQLYLRAVQHHEVGHSVGLRHNFAGSMDRNNYGDGYFRAVVDQDLDLPTYADFDAPALGGDGSGFVGGSEVENYRQAIDQVRTDRAALGTHNYMTASIMDYNGDMSDSYGLGRYDQAAVIWSHFNKAEAYVGDPRLSRSDSLRNLHRRFDDEGNTVQRTLWTVYEGGESCGIPAGMDGDAGIAAANAMCPASAGSSVLSEGQIITQRCIRNQRNTRLQDSCRAGDTDCVCSSFDRDFDDYRDSAPWAPQVRNDDGSLAFFPVRYLFGPDERANDLSFVTRFDVGETFQEAVAHFRRAWYEGYANSYNRRFRGVRPGASVGSVLTATKIYQHLFYRIFFEPGFQSNNGPLGFRDQFQASLDAMNWFIEIVNLPDTGSYEVNDGILTRVSGELNAPGSDVSMGEGMGFQMFSEFQEGHAGFSRVENQGVFYDKFFALFALSNRSFGLNVTQDESYPLNFYDLFPVPITEFFGGVILDRPSWFAPRYNMDTGTVEHMSWYRGLLLGECGATGARIPCRGANEDIYAVTDTRPAIDNTTNINLRSWATMLALAQFPVFYDTTFEQRLIVWRVGDGIGHVLPENFRSRVDGAERPYCAYGSFPIQEGHVLAGADGSCAGAADANYAVYTSDRLNFTYAAEKTYTREAFNLEEEQIGFQVLRGLIDLQEEVRALRGAGPSEELTRKEQELIESESYMEYLISLQALYGISSDFL